MLTHSPLFIALIVLGITLLGARISLMRIRERTKGTGSEHLQRAARLHACRVLRPTRSAKRLALHLLVTQEFFPQVVIEVTMPKPIQEAVQQATHATPLPIVSRWE